MDIEVLLFLIVGGISIAAAVMMLLDDNAVQSALFLILNFACVAFLYLMLDAAFLAMVQIAVYAGAIMVLFIFVIMLLNADKATSEGTLKLKWIAPIVLTVAMSLVIAIYAALNAGNIGDRQIAPANPMVRVLHAAADFLNETDVYLTASDGTQHIIEGVAYRDVNPDHQATGFIEVVPGDYSVAVTIADERFNAPFPVGTVTVAEDEVSSIILYGATNSIEIGSEENTRTIGIPIVATVAEDFSTLESREGRLIVFNAYNAAESVTMIDPGADFDLSAEETPDVYIDALPYGEGSASVIYDEGLFRAGFIATDNPDTLLYRLRDFEIERETSTLVIFSAEAGDDGRLIENSIVVVTDTEAAFGSPKALGQLLFVEYVLPFEMVAMLLLSAMVGAIVITQRADIKPKPGRPTRRKVSRPLTSVIASQTGHEVDETRPILDQPEDTPEQPEPAGD